MWAQDGCDGGYHAGAKSVAATLAPFGLPPVSLAGLARRWVQVARMATTASAAVTPVVGCDGVGADRDRQDAVAGVAAAVYNMRRCCFSGPHPDVADNDVGSMARESATRLGPPAGGLATAVRAEPE